MEDTDDMSEFVLLAVEAADSLSELMEEEMELGTWTGVGGNSRHQGQMNNKNVLLI